MPAPSGSTGHESGRLSLDHNLQFDEGCPFVWSKEAGR